MITVTYDPLHGAAFPDGEMEAVAEFTVKNYHDAEDHQVCVANEAMIDFYRLMVKRGLISHEKLFFKYKDILITVHKNGKLSHYPDGFCGYSLKTLHELIVG